MAHGPEQGGGGVEPKDGYVVILNALREWRKDPGEALGDFVTPEMVQWLLGEVATLRTMTEEMLSDLTVTHKEILAYLGIKRYGHRDGGEVE
jgi:hypothetical protein